MTVLVCTARLEGGWPCLRPAVMCLIRGRHGVCAMCAFEWGFYNWPYLEAVYA